MTEPSVEPIPKADAVRGSGPEAAAAPSGHAAGQGPSEPASSGRALQVRGLCKSFPTGDGALTILDGVDLQAAPGAAIAVVGPSGAGKSTLLHILGLLDTPSAGSVRLGEMDPFALAPHEQSRYRNQSVGFVFQEHYLLPHCTVLENVLVPTLAQPGAGGAALARARELLQRVGLANRLEHRPAQLSGGERQRTAVCRALLNRPALLLADEPTGNLDRRTAQAVGELLLELATEQQAILLCVTHSSELAARFPLRYELRDGRLEAS